jgi:hypothetical protein
LPGLLWKRILKGFSLKFKSTTLKNTHYETIARHVLLAAQVFRLRKQLAENFGKLNPLHPIMVSLEDQHNDNVEELFESGVLNDDEIENVFEELDAGTDVLDLLSSLMGQYKAEGIELTAAPKQTKMDAIINAIELGAAGDDLTEMRVNRVMTEFESPRQHDLCEYLAEDGTVQVLDELDDLRTGLTEDEIGELVRLEDEPLGELLSDMIAGGLIVEHEGEYIPLPHDESAA